MKRKENHKEKKKLAHKKLKQILNKNKSKPIEIRTKVNKMKNMQISKTHSMENISNLPKITERTKPAQPQKIMNNSMEEFDYLNFSEIDIDFYKKNSSLEDIFNPKYYNKNNKEKKQIVQNRYNMIDTSFDTIKTSNIITESSDEYINSNKNILLKTPSTICNYYDKSEINSEKKNNEKNNQKDNDKNIKFKKLKNKSIKIPNNNIINYNYPIHSNRTKRTKPQKNFSSSNIKLTQINNGSNTKNNFYKSKGNTTTNFIGCSKRKIKEDITSSILKKRNKENKNNIYMKVKNQNNLMKNYLKSNIQKNKNISKNNVGKKKSFSTKNYSGNITSQIIQNNKGYTNCNFTYNNDISNFIIKKTNIKNLNKSLKEQKENINNNIIDNNFNYNGSPNQEQINNKCQSQQKPIMLCLDKTKFSSYFITPTNSNSEKKENQKNSLNSHNNEKKNNADFLNFEINNNITENYTGRNNQNSFNNIKKDIIVKRKKLDKTSNNFNSCTKSITSNMNINTNSTFTNYQNDKPIIKVNLKKHIKSSSELIKFINVDTKNKNNKNSKNNKSSISICNKSCINSSQVLKGVLNNKKILKSPSQTKNNSTLKISKTLKENNNIINKIKTTPKYNKIKKGETFSTIEKKSYKGSNEKGYYSLKYELNLKNNNSNISKNKFIKNTFKPKTQSDIKINKFKIKEDNNSKKSNKENKDNNNDYGKDKRVKQKLLDRMNKVSKNNFGYIWGGNPGEKKNIHEQFCQIIKSPNKDYLFPNKFYHNSNKIISNENSKNEEKEFDKKEKNNEKRAPKQIAIIKEYNDSNISNSYI